MHVTNCAKKMLTKDEHDRMSSSRVIPITSKVISKNHAKNHAEWEWQNGNVRHERTAGAIGVIFGEDTETKWRNTLAK